MNIDETILELLNDKYQIDLRPISLKDSIFNFSSLLDQAKISLDELFKVDFKNRNEYLNNDKKQRYFYQLIDEKLLLILKSWEYSFVNVDLYRELQKDSDSFNTIIDFPKYYPVVSQSSCLICSKDASVVNLPSYAIDSNLYVRIFDHINNSSSIKSIDISKQIICKSCLGIFSYSIFDLVENARSKIKITIEFDESEELAF